MTNLIVTRLESTRLPTAEGEFQLYFYANNSDDKEHLALVKGEVAHQENVLVRIHSECYTGDVLGSQRCDCGDQLQRAMQLIAQAGQGAVIYLRQEGRGIGLLEKLRAYNLQDQGYDTVEANLLLGHQADSRDYTVAVRILEDLQIRSVRLLTNNPEKINSLVQCGLPVTDRLPLYGDITMENARYIQTKVDRLHHFPPKTDNSPTYFNILNPLHQRLNQVAPTCHKAGRPSVTLSYAQTLDGSIALQAGQHLQISNRSASILTHQLRASHDAILVGLGTVMADNPRLTVRLVDGPTPQPILLDSQLRCPLEINLITQARRPLWIMTTDQAPASRQAALEAQGVRIFRLPDTPNGRVDLPNMLSRLGQLGIKRLMVEGGGRVITSFINSQLVDQLLLTIAPLLIGGLSAIQSLSLTPVDPLPQLVELHCHLLEDNLIIQGYPRWQPL